MKAYSNQETRMYDSREFSPKPDDQNDTKENNSKSYADIVNKPKGKKNIIIFSLIITAAVFLAGITSYYVTGYFIAGGLQYSKSPEEALMNYIKSISKQNISLFVHTTDYNNSYKNIRTAFSKNDTGYDELTVKIKDYLARTNNEIAEKYGSCWYDNVTIVSSSNSSVEMGNFIKQKAYLTCKIKGYDTPLMMTALTTDRIKWFIVDEKAILDELKAIINNETPRESQ